MSPHIQPVAQPYWADRRNLALLSAEDFQLHAALVAQTISLSHMVGQLNQTIARMQGQSMAFVAFAMAVSQNTQGSVRTKIGHSFKTLCDEVRPDEIYGGSHMGVQQSFDRTAQVLADAFARKRR